MVSLVLEAAFIVNAIVGILLMLLAFLIFRVDPQARLTRALALVLLLRGATNTLGILGLVNQLNAVERSFAVALPLVMVWFIIVLVAEGLGRRVPALVPVGLAIVGVVSYGLELQALADPAIASRVPPGYFFRAKLATYAIAGGILAVGALRLPREQNVTGLTWAATGFLLNPFVWALGAVIRFPSWPISAWESGSLSHTAQIVGWSVSHGTMVVVLFVLFALTRAAIVRGEVALKRAVLVQQALFGAVILLAVGPMSGFDGTFSPRWVDRGDAITTAAFGLLASYAIFHHRVVDIDLRIKEWIPRVLTVGLVLVGYLGYEAFVVASASPDQVLWVRTVGVLVLVVAAVSLRGFGSRVAEVMLPGVRREPEYFEARRVEIYRDALREVQGLKRGADLAGDPVLTRLRASLGISDREHALLELATRPEQTSTRDIVPERTVLAGQYRIIGTLGSGGEGRTYLAKDEVLGRLVVLKTLHATDEAREAVVREARAFAAVDHPNVVTVHDVQILGNEAMLVMEHVSGGTLKEALANGPLAPDDVDRLVHDLSAALEAVHDAGLVHRDVKPSNLVRHRDGRWKLADFGLARSEQDDETIVGFRGRAAPAGTAAYMSPEQAQGERPTAATDLHAAGLTICEALRGAPVHARAATEDNGDLIRRIARASGTLTPPDVPANLAPWFDELLVADPSQRIGSAAEMRTAWPGMRPPDPALPGPGTAAPGLA